MSDKIYDVPADWRKRAFIDDAKYQEMYARSIKDPNGFWAEQAKRIDWIRPFKKVKNTTFGPPDVSIKWFEDGTLNACYNCVDRHLPERADHVAIIWEGDDPRDSKKITYQELHDEVCRMANILRNRNVEKGDRVTIYMPMIPEAVYAMLACARLGAVHSVVFGGFSPESLAGRIEDCQSKIVITADEGLRGGRKIPLKANVDAAIEKCGGVDFVVVVKHTGGNVDMNPVRDVWYHEGADVVTDQCPCTEMSAEDPLFILYTSGSTGKPKGVLHTTGGYLVYASITHQYVFDYHDGDIYWCTADVGWVTGTSYGIIAPLTHGVTSIVDEADFDAERWYRILQDHQVTVWYTAPTALRMPMRTGADLAREHDLSALRFVASVGEPLNPEAVVWGQKAFGLPVHDNWWQTETGGIMIANVAGAEVRPGSMGRPLPGVEVAVLKRGPDGRAAVGADGSVQEIRDASVDGELALRPGWPSMFRAYLHEEERYQRCFAGGWYLTGDVARRDADGWLWFVGRADDLIKSSGHLIGPFEVESLLMEHPAVVEAGVIGVPDPVAGEIVKAFVSLRPGFEPTEDLRLNLIGFARRRLGAAVAPRLVEFDQHLPKTTSGKIMRRLLKARELGLPEGDLSTLEGAT
jgi:acetyl-CoA synthetase